MYWNRQRRYALGITFCVILTVVGVAIAGDPFGLSLLKQWSGKTGEAANNGGHRVGTIVFELGPYRCQEVKFDNITGRFSESGPCDSNVVGSNEMPIRQRSSDAARRSASWTRSNRLSYGQCVVSTGGPLARPERSTQSAKSEGSCRPVLGPPGGILPALGPIGDRLASQCCKTVTLQH
jgi:hypothetical protein